MASEGSDETFDFVCTACEVDKKTREAVKYCIECQGYCCQACTDSHRKFPALRSHNLLDASQGTPGSNRSPKLPEFSTERCCQHKGKVVDLYCEHHDQVGCGSCIAKDHRSCPTSDIHTIPDMIGKLFNLSDSRVIHNQLKKMVVSLTALGESRNVQLKALNDAKKEAEQKIATFQKALEAAIKKAAGLSLWELNEVHKLLEKEILEDKTVIDKANDELNVTSTKLHKAESNRAQRFVCTKIGKEKITEAEKVMTERGKNTTDGKHISFTPKHSLMNTITGLQGIGQIGIPKTELYKIKGSKDVNIKVADDLKTCHSAGCCLTYDNHLLVTDNDNTKLKRIDTASFRVVDYCKFDSQLIGVSCISRYEAVVACGNSKKVQFVSIGDKMIPTRQINMPHFCYGVTTLADKLYVTDDKLSVNVYDMAGNLLKTISQDKSGKKLFSNSRLAIYNEKKNNLYVCDRNNGIVCLDNDGKHLSTVYDSNFDVVDGVCVDGRSNMFVVSHGSGNVVQFNEDGKKIGVVVQQQDGLQQNPLSACFQQTQNKLFVTMKLSNAVKMFELE